MIITGSKEFFPDGKDNDYIVFDKNQTEVFKHERKDGDCYFSYKELTKQEYFDWHENQNGWYLNFAPLITKEFLDHMEIDIFGADKDSVYSVMQKVFNFVYRNTEYKSWDKYSYRLWIYVCFMKNESFELTDDQLSKAKAFKKCRGDMESAREIYEFFEVPEDEIDDKVCSQERG